MIMKQLFGALLCLFPFSFLAYFLSERMLYIHQSRVGIGQSTSRFLLQGWINTKDLLRRKTEFSTLVTLAIQFSFVGLLSFFDSEPESHPLFGGFFLCLILNMMVVMAKGFKSSFSINPGKEVRGRIHSDQETLQAGMGSALALVCVITCFSIGGSWSVSEIFASQKGELFGWGLFWSPLQFIFFILFQIAGMLLFGEHPFSLGHDIENREHVLMDSRWIASARYYVWSLLGAQLFFGGASIFGESGGMIAFLVLQIKGLLIYGLFRVLALYFPRHSFAETLKLTFLFLIPISLAALVFVFMFHGIFNLGGSHV